MVRFLDPIKSVGCEGNGVTVAVDSNGIKVDTGGLAEIGLDGPAQQKVEDALRHFAAVLRGEMESAPRTEAAKLNLGLSVTADTTGKVAGTATIGVTFG